MNWPSPDLKNDLLKVHPEWKGKIWINKYSVTIRGDGSYWFEPTAEDVLNLYDYSKLDRK